MKRAAFPLLLSACTTLGPMPATTGISAMPIGRPGMEAQVGVMPGFYASQSAQNEAKGDTMSSLSLLLDPDRWLGVKGLLVGGRIFGNEGDRPIEPYIGYRRRLVEAISIGAVLFGSTKRTDSAAKYHGVRFGGEALADIELYAPNPWSRLHAQGAVQVARDLASGVYCVDAEGVGTDCSEEPANNTVITGKFVGVYPSATVTLAFDVGKHVGVFDSLRLAILGSAGQMPLVLDGEENGTGNYYKVGLSLSVAFGLGRPASNE